MDGGGRDLWKLLWDGPWVGNNTLANKDARSIYEQGELIAENCFWTSEHFPLEADSTRRLPLPSKKEMTFQSHWKFMSDMVCHLFHWNLPRWPRLRGGLRRSWIPCWWLCDLGKTTWKPTDYCNDSATAGREVLEMMASRHLLVASAWRFVRALDGQGWTAWWVIWCEAGEASS